MNFKVVILGDTPDGRVFMSITTKNMDRVESIKKFARKNKYKYKVEMIDD